VELYHTSIQRGFEQPAFTRRQETTSRPGDNNNKVLTKQANFKPRYNICSKCLAIR